MPRPATTPASIITAAVFMFVYGGLLMVCGVCGASGGAMGAVANAAVDPRHKDPNQERLQKIMDQEAPGHKIVGFANAGLNMVIGFVMIGLGIGVLKWSQIACYATYAVVALDLLFACGKDIYQLAVMVPATEKMMAEAMRVQGNQQAPPFFAAIVSGAGIGTVVVTVLIQLAMLLPIVICISMPGARAAFAGTLKGRPDDDDDRDRDRRRDDDDGYDEGYGSSKRPKHPGDTGIQE